MEKKGNGGKRKERPLDLSSSGHIPIFKLFFVRLTVFGASKYISYFFSGATQCSTYSNETIPRWGGFPTNNPMQLSIIHSCILREPI